MIGDSSVPNVFGDVHTDVLHLQQMVQMIHGLSDTLCKVLATFTYKKLSELQKKWFMDQVMKIISLCLFNNMHTPKSSDIGCGEDYW